MASVFNRITQTKYWIFMNLMTGILFIVVILILIKELPLVSRLQILGKI
jgi:hypothetical protein